MGIPITITLVIIANICFFGWMIHGRPKFISRVEEVMLAIMFLTAVWAGATTIAHVWVIALTSI